MGRTKSLLLLGGGFLGTCHHQHTHHTTHQTEMDGLGEVGEACIDEMVCEENGQGWLTGETRSYQLTLCREAC